MANVTYLLGAGASANCLPTYINFFERFQKFGQIFQKNNPYFQSLNSTQRRDAQNISEIINKISTEFQFHNTPDTIAKKYFHIDKTLSRLQELKEILILFFLHQQILKQSDSEKEANSPNSRQPLDKRYDAFIASLLKPSRGSLKFHDQFKILTWNYDLQFEVVYARYVEKKIPDCQEEIQSHPMILSDQPQEFDINRFGIIHLNGIAYSRGNVTTQNIDFLGGFFENDQFALAYLLDVYHSLRTIGIPGDIGGSYLLSFAWENQNEDQSILENKILEKAFQIADQTQILVVIGYSFPIFNRFIDKKILQKMTQLRKIYVQSPNSGEIKKILTDFSIPVPLRIEEVGYHSQFYVPHEWDSTV